MTTRVTMIVIVDVSWPVRLSSLLCLCLCLCAFWRREERTTKNVWRGKTVDEKERSLWMLRRKSTEKK